MPMENETKTPRERTLVLIKPDAVQRSITGEILTRFERVGLKIVACKMCWPNRDHFFHHYETIGSMVSRRGQEAFDQTLAIMTLGPVIALVLEGISVVKLVRKLVGETEPAAAAPGTIRGDYAHMTFYHARQEEIGIPTIVHASGDPGEAEQEIALWFQPEEIFGGYEIAAARFL